MTQRRILVASSVPLAPPWNGADKNMARLLAIHDEANSYLLQSNLVERWPSERVEVTRVKHPGGLPTPREKLRALAFIMRRGGDADLVHLVASLRQPNPLGGHLLRLWKRLAGRPLLHTALSVGDGALDPTQFPGDTTVVITEHDRTRLSAAGVRSVERVWPALDWSTLKPGKAPADMAARLDLGETALLYAGHYGPHGGVDECIAAFARLSTGVNKPVLVLACRAFPWQDPRAEAEHARTHARRLGVADRLRVVGEIADMPALILACAMTVLVPLRMEGKMAIPLVLLESLALERPIVTGSEPPLREALFGGGLAVPPGDITALSAALERLVGDPALRSQLGRTGREQVRRHCSPAEAVHRYRQIYERLLTDEV